MLLKKNRADKKAVEKIFKDGKTINSPELTFRFLFTGGKEKRISVVVPKGIVKKAVDRNRLRRVAYSVLQKNINKLPTGLLGVFVFKKYQAFPGSLPPRENILIIENEIKNIFNKLH